MKGGTPLKQSKRNADPCGAGSVHDPERRAVYTHIPSQCLESFNQSMNVGFGFVGHIINSYILYYDLC